MVIICIIIEIIGDVEDARSSSLLVLIRVLGSGSGFGFFRVVLLLLTEASRGIRGIIKINDCNPICPPNLTSIMITIDMVGL